MVDKTKKEESGSGKEPKAHIFKPDVGKFDSLAIGESFTGHFLGCKSQEITDQRSKDRHTKSVLVLKLREMEGKNVLKIAMATMLERAWEDVVDEYGNGDHDLAVNILRNRRMTINRGPDERTKQGNAIGTYEMIVWDD